MAENVANRREVLRRMEDRQCAAHQAVMQDIANKIERRVPIWTFLAALTIVSGIFGYVTFNQKADFRDTQAVIKELTKQTSDEVKELSRSVTAIKIDQAVMIRTMEDLGKKIEKNGSGK